jgi:M6 family metalloprotease-like protein
MTTPPSGFGGVPDYYSDVSYGAISFAQDKVFGWVPLPPMYTSTYSTTADRFSRIVACANALPGDIDFSKYYGVIAINNLVTGAGAVGPPGTKSGPVQMTIHGTSYTLGAVLFDPNSLFVKFAAHEVGHGLGFPHSYENGSSPCGGVPGEYCDAWDIMSWPFSFYDPNYSATYYDPTSDIPNPFRINHQTPARA